MREREIERERERGLKKFRILVSCAITKVMIEYICDVSAYQLGDN